ncbi:MULTISPECIES: glycoside hydrolase family 65 protein [Thermobifida]|uniref:glycoside hydrolase family 65 protein n=1 Tax=Thermobifida TaxID=83677 RepID=UPI000CEE2C2F|nr:MULTISPECIES: glycosyl hydrolase family 65 protein [Thermobifida]MBO2530126.1 trehalose 6-phosphate phosphorylase [Thermobifida sp.]PPS95004.1 trehalose 6-phosphate phosphorylase [Thermobifida fusca]
MNPWLLRYDGFDPATEGLREALCTLGNGVFATRGAAPESRADGVHYPGTYLAGCYNRLTSIVADHEVTNEDLVNIPNWLPFTFRAADGSWLGDGAELTDQQLELDMRRGVLTRTGTVVDKEGRRTRLVQRRLVSMDDRHLAALETTLIPENWAGPLTVRVGLDGRVTNSGVARYRDLNSDHLRPGGTEGDEAGRMWLRCRTSTSDIEIVLAARTTVTTGPAPQKTQVTCQDELVEQTLEIPAAQGEQVTVEKIVAVYSSLDHAVSNRREAARAAVEHAADFTGLLHRHATAWRHLWRHCDVTISNPEHTMVLHLHLFHILQTLSPHTADLDVGMPARGLHGEAYRGHVFWDELFVFPFLNTRFPQIARSLLRYRWRRLPAARAAARAAGYRGAMFPWQSGMDGREETQRLHLNPRSGHWIPDASHLQRHVGLAIAYNVWQHYQVTEDVDFLLDFGAELLVDIARFFASLATFDRSQNRYVIRGVMGPDEYHEGYPDRDEPGLDDNAYTNIMAVWVLRRALDVLRILPDGSRAELMERLGMGLDELALFEDVRTRMRVPFHEGVISQFAGYEHLVELDWEHYRNTYGDIRRLDRILEAEGDTCDRYKVSKQADVLMLFFLLSPDEFADILTDLGYEYDPGLIPRTIHYYLARTSHGSTLSAAVHAWVMARTRHTASWQFFVEALRSDIADVQGGTTAEGIHLGAMASTVDLVTRCYTGLEIRHGVLHLDPELPSEIDSLSFVLPYQGHWGIRLSFHRNEVRISVPPSTAPPVTVHVAGQTARVPAGCDHVFVLGGGASQDQGPPL